MSEIKVKRDGDDLSLDRLAALKSAIGRVVLGKDEVIELLLASLFSRGNVLIEDVPGVGKTTLAQALARSIDCSFRRVQFTSDLLPSDVLGVKVYDPASAEFKFMPGPIFHSIVLADEINRATPRSQSALLEAMSESRVTIEGETLRLPQPFMVIATENPLESHGAYPLPDSQLDRFMMSVAVGYPDAADEREMLLRPEHDVNSFDLAPVMDGSEVVRWQERVDGTRMTAEVVDYLLALVSATRANPAVRLGASPRASLMLRQAAKARALLSGRDFCLPDDVKLMARPVLSHRVIVAGGGGPEEQRRLAREAVEEALDTVSVPV